MGKIIIGVMGPGNDATANDIEAATELGRLIAEEGWVLLTGGRDIGVMDAASKGAQQAGGLTIGILPSENRTGASQFLDIPICTGMGSARNNINVLSSDVIVACGSGAGTTSEIMLALKTPVPLILLNPSSTLLEFIEKLGYPKPQTANTPSEVIPIVQNFL